ncbi:signal transduction histidine kinase [Actinomadura luteofluorescens]|uniref:histidine kinase n=1 Tax=Actinomadura luteofluorescens TaxID=46163 RepID=A0A7Y9EHP3_9ACTN|nr:ATP-binding protein [Actinomadura luteofluorescens]NYD47852.1 signal transduction histidine kinase [Actinomadura luteofluorescens]
MTTARSAETGQEPRAAGPGAVLPGAQIPEGQGMGRVRLVQIYRVGSAVLGALLLAAFVQAGTALYGNEQARDVLIERVDPATLEQFRLSTAITGQDTAIRAYAEEGGREHVEQYRSAVRQEAASAARMRRLLAEVPGHEEVDRLLAKATADSRAWRTGFADRVAAGPGGQGIDRGESRLAGHLLVQARGDMTPLQAGITELHERSAAKLNSRARTAQWSTFAALAMVVVAALLLAVLFRRTVLTPVSTLTGRVRAVSEGDFGHRLDVPGPAEINELAAIIDAMRARIIEEWRTSEDKSRRLDEQTEELRRSNAELEQFAYVASHDLQEPLRKVASFCQMLERRYGDKLDDRGRQYIAFAVDGAKRMQALINDLLSFSRVGRMSRPEDSVDLDDVVRQALDNLSTLCEETGAEVDVAELPDVAGDRTQLVQLFQNLVGNAIKFRREGVPPRVTIDVRRTGDEWEFGCSDNGIGIDPRYADRIFLIFQRLHSREEYTGTGIGLALCKKIVEYHGGRIWLAAGEHAEPDAEAATGTTFRWTLPAQPSAGTEEDGEESTGDQVDRPQAT